MNFKIAALALLTSLTLSTANLAANEILLSGRYEFRTDAQSLEMLGGLVCFYPDPESAKRVPRTPADQRIAWFCFKNDGVSKKMLNIPARIKGKDCGIAGRASLKVTDYVIYTGGGEGFDTAVLVTLMKKSAPKNLSCE